MDPSIVRKVLPYVTDPQFDPELIQNASLAAYGVSCWVRAVLEYDRVLKIVRPKRARLAAAEAEYSKLKASLDVKQAELRSLELRLREYRERLQATHAKKLALEQQAESTHHKLQRASELIAALGGEKLRWEQEVESLEGRRTHLLGDTLMGVAASVYLGGAGQGVRQEVLGHWVSQTEAAGIRTSGGDGKEDYVLSSVMGDAVQLREWQVQGLPVDACSADSAVMLSLRSKYPLIVDPQGLATRWLRCRFEQKRSEEAECGKGSGVAVVRYMDPQLMRRLEAAVQYGATVRMGRGWGYIIRDQARP